MLNKKVSKVKNMKEGMYIAYILNVNYATIVSWIKGVGTSTCLWQEDINAWFRCGCDTEVR